MGGTASRQQHPRSFTPGLGGFGRSRFGGGCRLGQHPGSRSTRFSQFSRDCQGGRSHTVGEAFHDHTVDGPGVAEQLGIPAELGSVFQQVGHVARTRDFKAANVIRELHAVVSQQFLLLAISKIHRDFQGRLSFAGVLGTPSGDTTEEMQAVGLEATHRHFDALGHGAGITATTFQHHHVAGRTLFGGEDVEGDSFYIHGAGFFQDDGVFLVFRAEIQTLGGVGGVGLAQIEGAEFSAVHRNHVSQDITQHFLTQSVKAFRHQAAAGIHAALDIGHLHLLLSGEALQGDAGRILPHDDPGVELTVLGLDIPRQE